MKLGSAGLDVSHICLGGMSYRALEAGINFFANRDSRGNSEEILGRAVVDLGHLLYVIDGELDTELRDGRTFKLRPGMSYQVSERGDAAHRSSTQTGAKLFIVDEIAAPKAPPLSLHNEWRGGDNHAP